MTSPDAWIVVEPGTATERLVPVTGLLLVGRECAGADPAHRLIVSDPAVSRDHFEIRVAGAGRTTIRDTSSNGTRVNGRRIERSEAIPLADGDTIELGSSKLRFRAGEPDEPGEAAEIAVETTIRDTGLTMVAIAVGDIVDYPGLVELHGAAKVASTAETVFGALDELLASHDVTVSDVAGDAIFAAWDASRDRTAAGRAVQFALAASELVSRHPAAQAIPDGDGAPLRMGWAVTLGEVGAGDRSAGHEALHGDAVTLAFRVAGVAAQDGRATVLVSARAAASALRAAAYGRLEEMHPEGYSSVTWVRAATRAGH